MQRKTMPRPGAPLAAPAATIAAFRQLAAQAVAAGAVADAPPHPDAELLVLAEEVLDLRRRVDALCTPAPRPPGLFWTRPELRSFEEARAKMAVLSETMETKRLKARRAGVLPAQTLAGLTAKALIVRACNGGAAALARSLADDLMRAAPADLAGAGRRGWPVTGPARRAQLGAAAAARPAGALARHHEPAEAGGGAGRIG